MYGGHSGRRGFVIYQKEKDATRAVYGRYVEDRMELQAGLLDEMTALKKANEEPDKVGKDALGWFMAGLMISMILAVVAVFCKGTFLQGIATLTFCITGYFPICVLFWATQKPFKTRELNQQFCRFHGCEHAVATWLTKYDDKKEVSLEKLKKMPIYDAECGTAYSGYAITLSVVLALLIGNVMTLGVLRALGILLAVVMLLLINIFNPWNPYKLLQRNVVSQPGEWEYTLGVAMIELLLNTEMKKDENR